MKKEELNIEIKLLLEAIFLKYGYDFRNYGQAHIKRRVMHRFGLDNYSSVLDMAKDVLEDEDFFNRLLLDLSINVTEMFRDPGFYRAVREKVVPLLQTYPYLKIWHAGCSSGEEVYSMAILLKEEGLLNRVQIYATDFNQLILKKAREGIYPIDKIKEYTANYQKAGGKASFADYYNAKYDSVIVNADLRKNIVFADHNLVLDGVFGEMNMVVCRNVMIYFNRELQDKVVKLFLYSLGNGGLLALGSKESLRFSKYSHHFTELVSDEKIYQRKTIAGRIKGKCD